jgi:molybdopterin converting factor small subunit
MGTLKVNFFPPFNELDKKSENEFKFDKEITLNELIEILYKKYGEKFKSLVWENNKKNQFHRQLAIIINGRTYKHENFLQTLLKDRDDISFLYEFFGG